jgi:aerobic carbon-monoxide dehydrogenase large subunit
VLPEDRVEVAIGTLSSGQGHQTSFAQLVVDWLGVPIDCITLIQGDTDVIPVGGGSHSGRSMRLAGIVIGKATDAVIARGKRIAAQVLEAAEHDIEFSAGRFTVQGTDRAVDLFEVARAAFTRTDLSDDLKGPLAAVGDETVKVGGCPYGSHVCEVEIDPDIGTIEIMSYAAVDDVGRAVNPRILHGQTHGAIAQGVGQVLLEGCAYDRSNGQLLSGSFMDYAIPRAHDLLAFRTEISEVISPTNPLGVRAGGEGGTTPALAVVVNAIVDALAENGVTHLDMPVTAERVWQALSRGKAPANP